MRIALVVAFCNLAGAFGGAIAYGIGHANGAGGLEGFRWLFIIEGLLTVVSSLLLIFCLPDYPARAKWLTADDKKFAVDRLKANGGGYNQDHASKKELLQTFFNPRMLAHYMAYVSLHLWHSELVLTKSIGCRRRSAGVIHLLHTHYRHGSRLHLHPCSASHRSTLGHWLLRRHYLVIFSRSLQCPRFPHRFCINFRRDRLASSRASTTSYVRRTIRLSLFSSSWRLSVCP